MHQDSGERFVDKDLSAVEFRETVRRKEIFLWVSFGGWTFFGLQHFFARHGKAAIIHFAAASFMALLLIACRYTKSSYVRLIGNLGLVGVCAGFFADQMVSGQVDAGGLPYFVLLPLAASYILSRQAAAFWCAVAVIMVGAIAFSSSVWPGPITPEYTEHGLDRVPSMIGLVGIAYLIARASRNSFDVQLERASRLTLRVREKVAEAEKAKDQALTIARLKDGLIANTSHELRTPLNGILGTLSLLELGELESRQRDLVENAKTSAEHLASLLADILDLSALQAGALRLVPEPTDPRDVLEDVLDVLGSRAVEKGIDLTLEFPPDVPMVMLDPMRLRQVVLNIVGNAVKFTDSGYVDVKLRVPPTGNEIKVRLQITVKDSGPGMSGTQLAKLFRPFEQGDPSRTRRTEGTGLGLAVSQRLANALGGGIEVTSEPGMGSTFTISVLVDRAPSTSGSMSAQLAGTSCLVIEPDERVRTSICTTLESLQVRARGVGTEAELDSLPSATTDTIILGPAFSMEDASRTYESLGLSSHSCIALLAPLRGMRAYDAGKIIGVLAPPRRKRLAAALSRTAGTQTPAAPKPNELKPSDRLRVLIVDDAPVNRLVSTGLVEALGHRADSAPNGPAALESVTRTDYDAVIVDLQMPGMSGFEVIGRLRELVPEERRPRVVVSSASVDPATRREAMQAHADDFLPKPVRLESLDAVLKNVVKRSAPTSAPRFSAAPKTAPAEPPTIDIELFEDLRSLFPKPEEFSGTCQHFLALMDGFSAWSKMPEAADPKGLRAKAHTIRGTAGTIGAARISWLAGKAEDAVVGGRMDEAFSLIPEILREANLVSQTVRALLDPAELSLDRRVDIEENVQKIPEDSMCRGVLFNAMLDAVRNRMKNQEALEDALRNANLDSGPYLAFGNYPFRDLHRLAGALAPIAYPEDAQALGLSRLGRTLFPAFARSIAGRQIFGLFGATIERLILSGSRAWSAVFSVGKFSIERRSERELVVKFEDYPSPVDAFEHGMVTGALEMLGVSVESVRVRSVKGGGEMHIRTAIPVPTPTTETRPQRGTHGAA